MITSWARSSSTVAAHQIGLSLQFVRNTAGNPDSAPQMRIGADHLAPVQESENQAEITARKKLNHRHMGHVPRIQF